MRAEPRSHQRWMGTAIVGLALVCTVACAARFSRSHPPRHAAVATALETVDPASSTGSVAQPPNAVPGPVNVPEQRAIAAQEHDADHETAEHDDAHEADLDLDHDDDKKHQPGADSPDDALEFRRLQQQDENGNIPVDGLTRARKQADAMRAFQSAMGAIADFLGFDAPPPGAGIGSGTWTWLGPGNIGGRLRSIVVNPVLPSTWFAGSVSGGIWKTIDSGAHWEVVNDFLANLSVSTMVMQPDNPMVLYAGTGEYYQALQGAGIFKSIDGGNTWTLLSSTATDQAYHYVNRLAISSNGAVLLAATWIGIYRSIDGGATFNLVLNTNSNPDFDNPTYVAFNPVDNSKAIASAYDGRVWYSTNSGLTWNVASGIPAVPSGERRVELAYAPGNPSIVYASVNQSGGTIYKSTDGGVTYSFVSTGTNYLGNQGWYDNTLWVDPANPNTLVIGGISLYKSIDGGLTLTNINGIVHADKHTIVSMPGYNGTTNRQVLIGCDGGIYFVNDIYAAPAGWTSLNNNLGVTQFYGAAGNATSGTIVGGTQDNGTLRYTTAGGPQAHTAMAGGDGGYAASDPTDPNVFYGEFQRLGMHRSSNGGASSTVFFNSAIPDFNGNSNFIAPFVLDPNDPHTLLAGGASLWRTNNAKFGNPPTFTSIKSPIGTFISAIAIAPGNSNICWVGYNNGNVYRSTDCTALSPSWLQVDNGSTPLPNRMVIRLTIDPTDTTGNRVYATFGGFSPANVWRTINGGTSWSSASGSGAGAIPSVPVHDLDVLPSNQNWLYAATEIGIFTSQDSGVSWQIPQDGPANVVVSELFWMGPDLVAATFGRGLYKTQAAGQTPGTLTGVIRDATTNGGIVGATVSLSPGGVSTVSGVTGAYTLTIPPGSYTVTVAASGKGTATFSGVLVTGGVTTTRDFAIGPQGTLTGHVRDATTNAGIANATVSATPGGVTVTTDATGLYTANLAAGTYSVRAMTSTRPQVSVPGVVVTYGATTTQDFLLQAGALQQSQGPTFGPFSIGRIELPLSATGGNDTYVWSIVGGALPPGIALRTDNPASFPLNASAGLVGIATTPGIYNFALRVTSGAQVVDQACSLKVTALAIKDGNHFDYLPEAFAGAFYSYALTPLNNAGPVSWTATGVPAGMSLSASGVLSGIPASQGFPSLNLSLSDGVDTVSRSLFLPIYAINVTPGVLPNATLGAAYTATLTATGGTPPYTFSGCCPPFGLTLSSTGTISGTVSSFASVGPTTFFVTVTDSINNSYSKHVSIDVLGAPVLPSVRQYGTFDDCTFGVTCSRGIAVATGGTAPFVWTATGLPPGMSIRSATGGRNYVSSGPSWGYQQAAGDAELWGVPTQIGTFNIQITATDANGVAATQVFPLKVSHLGQPNANAFAPVINSPFARAIRVLGGTPPYSGGVVNGSLPAGMTFDGLSLLLSGTPLENGFFNPVFQFTDAAARSVRLTENISISGTPTPVFINDAGDLGQTPHNAAYSRQLSACCVGSYLWSLVSGALPPGVTLSSAGLLSGVANVSGTYTFLIKATDSANSASFGARQFTLRVTTISINGNFTLPNGNVGAPYTNVFGATGGSGALTWTVAPFNYLPPGLTLSAGGVLSGTPTATGQFFFTIRATDPSLNMAERQFGVSIFPAVSLPLVLNTGPSFTIPIGRFTVQLAASGGAPPYHYSVTPGATVIPGMRVQDGAPLPLSFAATTTAGYIGVITIPGTYATSIRVTDSNNTTFDRAITVTALGFNIVSQATAPNATVNTPYSFAVTAYPAAGSYGWSASGLPAGLAMNPGTGVISGMPTTAGKYSIGVTLTDTATSRSVFQSLSLTVDPFAVTTLTGGSVLPPGMVGAVYTAILAPPNCGVGGCAWSVVGTLPSGLSLSTPGVISGMPTSTFNGSVTVNVTGLNGSVQKTFGLQIASTPSALQITTGSSFTSTIGVAPLIFLAASGGTAPYTWSLSSGALPPGITLQGPGENLSALLTPGAMYLGGRPMVLGTYTFTLAVTDALNVTATRAFTWNIAHLGIDYLALPLSGTTLIYNAPYSQPLLALGGTPSYTWTATGTMPAGLTLSSAGIVSGTPAVAGSLSTLVQVRSSDSALVYPFNLSFTITGGRIRGRVTNAATSTGLAAVSVQIYDSAGRFVTSSSTDASGNYTSPELKSGTYFARTQNSFGFIEQAYDGVTCSPCSEETTTPITVTAPNSADNINFALTTGGRVNGRVTQSSNGAGLPNVEVDIYNSGGEWVTYGFSDASGNYTTFAGVPTGTYFARTFNSDGYVDKLYNNITCVSCSVTTGTSIAVTAPAITTGINFALDSGGRISGNVVKAAGGAALASIEVDIYDTNNRWLTYGFTDASGNYTTTAALPPGNYFALTWNSAGYINKLYQNIDCVGCTPNTGAPIAVAPGVTTPNINFALSSGGRVSGSVTAGGAGLATVEVAIYGTNNQFVTYGFSDASGNYISYGGLPSGTYFARTFDTGPYQGQLYNNIACTSCSPSSGTPIVVTTPATAGGINFALVTTASKPTLAISDASVTEGNSGTTNALFTVTLSAASTQVVTVAFATEDGDAMAASDYIATSGSRVFMPGDTVKQIAVPVKGDTVKEPDEKFAVRLSNANGALIGDGLAQGTILNDDNASIGINPPSVGCGDTVTVTFSGGPGSPGDWWGVYLVGDPDTAYKSWGYLNGQHTMPVTGLTDATLSITLPGIPGTYEIRWWSNNSLLLIVKTAQITVTCSAATLTVTPTTVNGGASVTATFGSGPGNRGDWWGVYLVGAPDADYKSWGYLNGQHTMPASGLTDAVLPIQMPAGPGTYEIRWWENNTLTRIVESEPITVLSVAPATVDVTPTTVKGGANVTATFSHGPGNAGDWWGVYLVGAADIDYKAWGYLNGQHTMPVTGLTDATLPITMPNAPGTFEIRWWQNNSLMSIAKSGPITVEPSSTVTVTPSRVGGGGTVSATFAKGPGNATDWWGVYLVGAPDVDYKSWGYMNGLHTPPAAGVTDTTRPITIPDVAGTYEVRWWANNGLTLITKSGPIEVATVTLSPPTAATGGSVTATFTNGPGNPADWWGVYLVGAPDNAYISWGYLNGLHTAPASGMTSAMLSIAMPAVAGTYEVRWWANNDLIPIAKSQPIAVTSAATVTATPGSVAGAESVSVTFASGPGNAGDWWGVYLVGAPDVDYKSWGYLNGLHTTPASGLTDAILSIAMPTAPGTYEIRWWANNGLQLIAKSGPVTVVSSGIEAIERSIPVAASGR